MLEPTVFANPQWQRFRVSRYESPLLMGSISVNSFSFVRAQIVRRCCITLFREIFRQNSNVSHPSYQWNDPVLDIQTSSWRIRKTNTIVPCRYVLSVPLFTRIAYSFYNTCRFVGSSLVLFDTGTRTTERNEKNLPRLWRIPFPCTSNPFYLEAIAVNLSSNLKQKLTTFFRSRA